MQCNGMQRNRIESNVYYTSSGSRDESLDSVIYLLKPMYGNEDATVERERPDPLFPVFGLGDSVHHDGASRILPSTVLSVLTVVGTVPLCT